MEESRIEAGRPLQEANPDPGWPCCGSGRGRRREEETGEGGRMLMHGDAHVGGRKGGKDDAHVPSLANPGSAWQCLSEGQQAARGADSRGAGRWEGGHV